MQTVLLTIAHVVDQIGRARQQAQHEERPRDLRSEERLVDHPGGAGRREDEQVLAPLARTARPQQHPGRRSSRRPQLDRRLHVVQLSGAGLGLSLLDACYRLK
jgi:hypothetical protein